MTNAPDPKQVADFLSNKAYYADAEAVHAWLSGNMEALDNVILTEDLEPEDLVRIPQRAKRKAFRQVTGLDLMHLRVVKRWLAAAAITGLMFTLTLWLITSKKEPARVSTSGLTVQNTTGKWMHYMLPDSSAVSLMPGAVITFKNSFALNRLVTVMLGDVYIKVKKDPQHPFRVVANGISTTATGTEFWVQHLAADRLNIFLKEGKVFVNAADSLFKMDTVFLLPGQNCTINKKTGLVSIWGNEEKRSTGRTDTPAQRSNSFTDAGNAMVWTNREIQLSNTALASVLEKLEHRYKVKIIASDAAIYRATMTGKIFYNDSLDVLITAICELNQLSYEKSNDTIFLRIKK